MKENINKKNITELKDDSPDKLIKSKRKREHNYENKDNNKERNEVPLFEFSPASMKRKKADNITVKKKKSKQVEKDLNFNKLAIIKGVKWNEEESFE